MKLTLYMDTSLDGFIASESGDTPWSQPTWDAYYEIVKAKKNIIVGRKTYELMVATDGEFEKCGHPFTVVLSDTRSGSPDGRTMFAKTPDEALAMVKGQGFTEALLGGGGKTNGAFLTSRLIDEIILDIEPVLLGQGLKLFGPNAKSVQLEFLEMKPLAKQVLRVRARVKYQ